MMNFKKISIMEFRKKPGEILDKILREETRFVIFRNDKPVACLVPLSTFYVTPYPEEETYEDFDPSTIFGTGEKK